METPQYLRRRLFKMMEELRYVGVLPPLRTPHHPLEKISGSLKKGGFREGVVLSEKDGEFLVEIGVEVPARVTGRGPSVGSRVTVRITDVRPMLRGRFAGRKEVESYWGYNIHVVGGGLSKLASRNDFDLMLATSRHAPLFRDIESQFRVRLAEAKSVLIAFGSPRNGIREILSKDDLDMSEVFDFSANVIPDQGSVTVRTEEALAASLSLIGMLR
jgi:predicted SPOUT superfamily RNA methylase MTH1